MLACVIDRSQPLGEKSVDSKVNQGVKSETEIVKIEFRLPISQAKKLKDLSFLMEVPIAEICRQAINALLRDDARQNESSERPGL